ncbi:hypothetical protein EHS25_000631 [Saitozyma podzolica]|uniref:Xylanolytic transcriptional activator regulatory domain-containing protein n=1 Tax=Saitozyma podzolica TaxID=1890683 RepID=A0A427YWS5_9TREE|nr:hypothetical protein EHS25_000631 [Saitozyma podzolica]
MHRPRWMEMAPLRRQSGTDRREGAGVALQDTSPVAVNPDPNPLEAIIPRAVLDHAVNTYFKYLFGLVPVVHRPTFISDFTARREELPGQEEWTALVFAIVGVSFSQVPWDFVTMSKSDLRDMVQKCYDRVKDFVFDDFAMPTTTRCVLLYLTAIMATRLGHRGIREMCLGANWGLIFKMRIHDESSYIGIGAIEAEIRRRIFWLAMGFDKSAHAVHGTAPHTTREHCATVGLPSAIDDEFLTDNGYTVLSAGANTSILSGFRYVSRLYGLFGHILDMRRLDQHHTPSGDTLKMRLLEVEELFEQMTNLMAGCPEELRLREHGHSVSSALDWAEQSYEDIRLLFEHPNSRTMVADSFLVQQANIYTTMHMTRLLTLR